MTKNKVVTDARQLSSGTIAGLIDNNSYAVVDKVRAEFVSFCEQCTDGWKTPVFETWVDAWKAFEKAKFHLGQYVSVTNGYGHNIGVKKIIGLYYNRSAESYNGDLYRYFLEPTDTPWYAFGESRLRLVEDPDREPVPWTEIRKEDDRYMSDQEEDFEEPANYPTVKGDGTPQYTFSPADQSQLSLKL